MKHRVKSAARYAALGAALAAGAAQTTASSEVAHAGAGTRTAVAASDSAAAPLWMEMRNVDLHVDERRVMHMRSLHGEVVPAAPGKIPVLDDAMSFRIRATGGTVALDADVIAMLLNTITFNYPGAPVRHLRVRIENGALIQEGVLHKGVDLPFEMQSKPALERDGRLRLHPDKLRIFSINGLALMRALGLHLDQMMDLRGARGASVKGDDLFVEPLKLIPPPYVDGRLGAVRIEGNLLVQDFVRTPDDTVFGTYVRPDSGARNFVYFRGGELRFGKLTMTDTDLLINDSDERDPLDLYFARYNRQLVAGTVKTLANYGLRALLVDYHSLGANVVARSP